MNDSTVERTVTKIDAGQVSEVHDTMAVEEPCEIHLSGEAVAVTMRTPGNDLELAAGFLFTEGIVGAQDVATVNHCGNTVVGRGEELHPENIVEVRLIPGRKPRRDFRRHFFASSSCGICGKASIEAIHVNTAMAADGPSISAAILTTMMDQLKPRQNVFAATGGLHAAAIFNVAGELLVVREDVGRHNAVDKAIGYALIEECLPLDANVLIVSGRTSFEIVQKALVAQIPIVASVSAASSLAVEFAAQSNMTLVGFLRDSKMNVYAGAERVAGK